jgi:AraC-like DNA-binding protein
MQTICGIGKSYLKQNQFASAYGAAMQKSILLRKRKTALFVDFVWTEELLQQLLPADSPYWSLLKQQVLRLPTLVGEPYRHTNPALEKLLHTLFDAPYSSELQEDTVNTLMAELLESVLSASLDDIRLPEPISGIEVRKVNDARRFILDNIGHHFPIDVIAAKVGLSRTMLTKRFRQITGKGIHEFLMYHRCTSIREELMNTNIPFKVLAKKAGYSDVPNFINGFKKHMGCSPAALRKGH